MTRRELLTSMAATAAMSAAEALFPGILFAASTGTPLPADSVAWRKTPTPDGWKKLMPRGTRCVSTRSGRLCRAWLLKRSRIYSALSATYGCGVQNR